MVFSSPAMLNVKTAISVCPEQEKMSGKWLEDDEPVLKGNSNKIH